MSESDNHLQLVDNTSEPPAIPQLSSADLVLSPLDIEVDTGNAIRLPLDQVPALGAMIASLPKGLRTVSTTQTVTQSFSSPKALIAMNEAGQQLDPSILFTFKDSFGSTGGYLDAANKTKQAHLVQAAATNAQAKTVVQSASVMPLNLPQLFMAAALVQINVKLDAIQKTQEEMFAYLKRKDKAKQRGNLKVLADTLDAYAQNWDNVTWCSNHHMKVIDIQQDADQSAIELRAHIREKLGERGLVESRLMVAQRLDAVCDLMREYQLAVYLYGFASFLKPMLCGNFEAGNLDQVSSRINERSTQYREHYTSCYDAIEASAKGSVDAALLGGVSLVGKSLGSTIAASPVGDLTRVDDALIDGGKAVEEFNDGQTEALLARLREAKSPGVRPFIEGVDETNRLHNRPLRLLVDAESVYLLPEDATCGVA